MKRKKTKKPYFSKKGDPEGYDYMRNQWLIIGIMAIFFLVVVGLVECGVA